LRDRIGNRVTDSMMPEGVEHMARKDDGTVDAK